MPISPHTCRISDAPGGGVGCICMTGRDHDEDEMDLPQGQQTRAEKEAS